MITEAVRFEDENSGSPVMNTDLSFTTLQAAGTEYTGEQKSRNSPFEHNRCSGCRETIMDLYLLWVNDKPWHAGCLRCSVCRMELQGENTCFIKDDAVFCRLDYAKQFGGECAKCLQYFELDDMVRRVREKMYHLECFMCEVCDRQLNTGDEFVYRSGSIMCKSHTGNDSADDGMTESESQKDANGKRKRTFFTPEQLEILTASFDEGKYKDGANMERIAHTTGLSKKVIKIWFQNKRQKQKRMSIPQ